jgi:hypothetical protein
MPMWQRRQVQTVLCLTLGVVTLPSRHSVRPRPPVLAYGNGGGVIALSGPGWVRTYPRAKVSGKK